LLFFSFSLELLLLSVFPLSLSLSLLLCTRPLSGRQFKVANLSISTQLSLLLGFFLSTFTSCLKRFPCLLFTRVRSVHRSLAVCGLRRATPSSHRLCGKLHWGSGFGALGEVGSFLSRLALLLHRYRPSTRLDSLWPDNAFIFFLVSFLRPTGFFLSCFLRVIIFLR